MVLYNVFLPSVEFKSNSHEAAQYRIWIGPIWQKLQYRTRYQYWIYQIGASKTKSYVLEWGNPECFCYFSLSLYDVSFFPLFYIFFITFIYFLRTWQQRSDKTMLWSNANVGWLTDFWMLYGQSTYAFVSKPKMKRWSCAQTVLLFPPS